MCVYIYIYTYYGNQFQLAIIKYHEIASTETPVFVCFGIAIVGLRSHFANQRTQRLQTSIVFLCAKVSLAAVRRVTSLRPMARVDEIIWIHVGIAWGTGQKSQRKMTANEDVKPFSTTACVTQNISERYDSNYC